MKALNDLYEKYDGQMQKIAKQIFRYRISLHYLQDNDNYRSEDFKQMDVVRQLRNLEKEEMKKIKKIQKELETYLLMWKDAPSSQKPDDSERDRFLDLYDQTFIILYDCVECVIRK